jgi:AraC family transcriptional regulator of adaptative response/methylated-DNA-[protein]-cysteine methyltransferase
VFWLQNGFTDRAFRLEHDHMNAHYQQIAHVIDYVLAHQHEQPDLATLAAQVHLSPYHFQRLFQTWAGVSPKKFLQYLTLQHAKAQLAIGASQLDTALAVGLSSSSRLHDLFVNIEGMTPAEYRNGGQDLTVDYITHSTAFGDVVVAATAKGICALQFIESSTDALTTLQAQFPAATYRQQPHPHHQALMAFFEHASPTTPIHLHLKGTPFQLKVWEALLRIPEGQRQSYQQLANRIEQPRAVRAVGTAIGQNPIAWLIPCHRVIQSRGLLGGYRWGLTRKACLLGWEAAQQLDDHPTDL